ncbi:DNA alkylation repair protein [Chitinophaga sp. GCM10012297]|uniref:DNA alkylation repair protein n=1 Tax=Chitinophaga chungangae TaxID=2821488 RepID=A0ABS3YKY4_9BACT|nr:DNA alkylation repair protein [Chitinophaga chungangae]MBO9155317.1 DNA alkylation repair protein [Chitinophaga chungangae]
MKKTNTVPNKTTAKKATEPRVPKLSKTPPAPVIRTPDVPEKTTADNFIKAMQEYVSPAEREKLMKYFKQAGQDQFIGIRMGQLFALAKAFIGMPPAELDKLLQSPVHEVRAGALSIMDKQGRSNKTPDSRRKELYDLYLKRHERIDNWDLVDLAAQFVIGRYLIDKPRTILTKLAKSKNEWERRTAITATAYFMRQGEVEDTFKIAAMLVHDPHDLVQKAVGGWIRQAGKGRHRRELLLFLDRYAATMPRAALRYAIEHLSERERQHYLGLKQK